MNTHIYICIVCCLSLLVAKLQVWKKLSFTNAEQRRKFNKCEALMLRLVIVKTLKNQSSHMDCEAAKIVLFNWRKKIKSKMLTRTSRRTIRITNSHIRSKAKCYTHNRRHHHHHHQQHHRKHHQHHHHIIISLPDRSTSWTGQPPRHVSLPDTSASLSCIYIYIYIYLMSCFS